MRKVPLCTIDAMCAEYGTDAKDLKAIIGPGISRASFQVGQEVVDMFREADFPMDDIYEWQGEPEKGSMRGGHHIDLILANKWLLEGAGIRPENIRCAGICTYQDARFYSARREGAACGRIINAVRLG